MAAPCHQLHPVRPCHRGHPPGARPVSSRRPVRPPGPDSASAIALALLAAALGYGTLTLFDPLALHYLGKRLPYRQTALASFTGYAFSHNLGFGWLSGGAVRYRLYTAWGLSSLDIGIVLAFNTVTTFLGLGSILALACLGEPDEIAGILRIPQPGVVVLGLALGLAVAGYVALSAIRRSPIGFAGWQLDVPRPAIAAAQIVLSLLDWVLAAAVLYVLLPAGLAFGFMSFVGLFGLANLGGLISNVPGGIGVFEAVVLLAVPDGGASGAIAAALIGYRLIYYLLPLVVAALLLGGHQLLATGELARRVGSWALILAPNLFALIVFVAGIVLLATGARRPSPDACRRSPRWSRSASSSSRTSSAASPDCCFCWWPGDCAGGWMARISRRS